MMLMLWWFGFVKIFVGGGRRCESWREEKIFLGTARRNINMGNWRESKFSLPPAAAPTILALAPHIIIIITITITITYHRTSSIHPIP